MSKMNSTNLYVTTNQIILKSQPENPASWQDLYRLLPYLRNSLSCVVCGGLLVSPITPTVGKCQHHLCKKCTGGKKKIKPACVWCKDCDTYSDNRQLRTLLQCYKKMCAYLLNSSIYKLLMESAQATAMSSGVERGASNLIALIREGALFHDHYESNIGLSKEIYSILPCVYTNSSTQTLQNAGVEPSSKSVVMNSKSTNGSPMYSVMFAGSGNKITIKRKPKEAVERSTTTTSPAKKEVVEKSVFKKPSNKCSTKARRGCRCGNATATPGKLTCCGQRCPCYVESKACVDCKCRGCRNPHTSDGNKVLNISHVLQYQEHNQNAGLPQTHLQAAPGIKVEQPSSSSPPSISQLQAVPPQSTDVSLLQHVKIELDANLTFEQLNQHLKLNVFEPFSKVPSTLPHAFLMNTKREDDDEEITVDI